MHAARACKELPHVPITRNSLRSVYEYLHEDVRRSEIVYVTKVLFSENLKKWILLSICHILIQHTY